MFISLKMAKRCTFRHLHISPGSLALPMGLPRFKRENKHGKRVCYLTIPDPEKKSHAHLTLYNIKEVKEYLVRIGYQGSALQEALMKFDFSVPGKRASEGEDDNSRLGSIFEHLWNILLVSGHSEILKQTGVCFISRKSHIQHFDIS